MAKKKRLKELREDMLDYTTRDRLNTKAIIWRQETNPRIQFEAYNYQGDFIITIYFHNDTDYDNWDYRFIFADGGLFHYNNPGEGKKIFNKPAYYDWVNGNNPTGITGTVTIDEHFLGTKITTRQEQRTIGWDELMEKMEIKVKDPIHLLGTLLPKLFTHACAVYTCHNIKY
jgi:hypothetical protein